MVGDDLAPSLLQGDAMLGEPTVEQREVTAIGRAGVLREALFQPEGVEKTIDQMVRNRRHGHETSRPNNAPQVFHSPPGATSTHMP
ncbi:hypothetical protein D3C72_2303440 [compost metagenome]